MNTCFIITTGVPTSHFPLPTVVVAMEIVEFRERNEERSVFINTIGVFSFLHPIQTGWVELKSNAWLPIPEFSI